MPDTREIKSIRFQPGSAVFVQDSPNPGFFYIVKEGLLSVHSGTDFTDKELSRFEPGDTFGLVSALTVGRHLGTIQARSEAILIRVPVELLGQYLHSNRQICLKMLSLYSRELKALDKHLANLNPTSSWDNTPEKLYLDHETYESLKYPRLAAYCLRQFVRWVNENPSSRGQQYLEAARQKLDERYASVKFTEHDESNYVIPQEGILLIENEPGRHAFVIKSGSVKVFKLVQGQEFVVAVLGPGEIVGEQSLLENKPYSASVVAKERTEVVRLRRETFMDEAGDAILQKIFESLARRIWFSHQRLAILKVKSPVARLYFFLLSQTKQMRRTGNVAVKFFYSITDLTRMCGLLKVKKETISDILNDDNVAFQKNAILVHDAEELEKKALTYKYRSGKDAERLFL